MGHCRGRRVPRAAVRAAVVLLSVSLLSVGSGGGAFADSPVTAPTQIGPSVPTRQPSGLSAGDAHGRRAPAPELVRPASNLAPGPVSWELWYALFVPLALAVIVSVLPVRPSRRRHHVSR
jgi:hypothetical protein